MRNSLTDLREQRGLSQADLADRLNEKASLIRKLERINGGAYRW